MQRFVKYNDLASFETLVKKNEQFLDRLLYGIFKGNREDIEDARQEILIELYLKAKRFRYESNFKTYLFRLAKNRAIDILRKKVRERNKVLRIKRVMGESINKYRIEDPQEMVLKREKISSVMEAIYSLSNDERILVIAKDVEGMSLKDIAEAYKLPLGTVKSKLHRARDKLVELLGGNYEK